MLASSWQAYLLATRLVVRLLLHQQAAVRNYEAFGSTESLDLQEDDTAGRITVFFKSDWEDVFLHGSIAGGEWKDYKGQRVSMVCLCAASRCFDVLHVSCLRDKSLMSECEPSQEEGSAAVLKNRRCINKLSKLFLLSAIGSNLKSSGRLRQPSLQARQKPCIVQRKACLSTVITWSYIHLTYQWQCTQLVSRGSDCVVQLSTAGGSIRVIHIGISEQQQAQTEFQPLLNFVMHNGQGHYEKAGRGEHLIAVSASASRTAHVNQHSYR